MGVGYVGSLSTSRSSSIPRSARMPQQEENGRAGEVPAAQGVGVVGVGDADPVAVVPPLVEGAGDGRAVDAMQLPVGVPHRVTCRPFHSGSSSAVAQAMDPPLVAAAPGNRLGDGPPVAAVQDVADPPLL